MGNVCVFADFLHEVGDFLRGGEFSEGVLDVLNELVILPRLLLLRLWFLLLLRRRCRRGCGLRAAERLILSGRAPDFQFKWAAGA